MKKSLVALAVLAASGAAMAQSSVTLYGIADLWVGSVKNETAGGASTTTTSMVGSGVDTSRWGMKGSEDLGGGLKANFNLEQGFNLDSGTPGSTTQVFDRQAWVGLSGGFGEVKFGTTGTAFDNVQGKSQAVFGSDLSPTNKAGTAGGLAFRTDNNAKKTGNNIHYQAPSFSGFSGAVSYSLDEGAANIAYTSFNVTYGAGPVAVQLAYQKDESVATNDADQTNMVFGASYNFGVATAKFLYGNVDDVGFVSGEQTTEWQLGADVPLSAALTLSVGYGKSTDEKTAVTTTERERSGFGAALAYSLSKRTTVYGGLKMVTDNNGAAADVDTTVYAVGINHKF